MGLSRYFIDKAHLQTGGVEIQKRVRYLVNTNIILIGFFFIGWGAVGFGTGNYTALAIGYFLNLLLCAALVLIRRNHFVWASNLTVLVVFVNIMVVVLKLPFDSYLVLWRPATYMVCLLVVCGIICFRASQIVLPALLSLVSFNLATWLLFVPKLGEITSFFYSSYVAINVVLVFISMIAYYSFSFSQDLVQYAMSAQAYIMNMFNSMPSMLISADERGIVTRWNRRAEEMTGISASEAVGRQISGILPSLTDELQQLSGAVNERRTLARKKTSGGAGVPVKYEDITIAPLIEDGARGVVIRVDDVTREEELEQQLNQSRKMDAIGQLAGGVAHDFNNMLGGIIGAAELVRSHGNLCEKSQELVDLILNAAQRASDLTSQLLVFSRKSTRVVRPVDVARVISDAAALLDRSIDKRIRIHIENKAAQAVIMGDGSQLHNALLNMGINAAHAMPDGGELSFTTTNIILDERTCAYMPLDPAPGNYLEIEVRDTGCGIPLEDINRIFEPFYTTREPGEGTGLGLAAVYGIVHDHQGSIKVYSEVGRGTVFHIYLPLADDVETVCGEGIVETGSGLILLVDDEEIIRHTSAAMLEKLGYTVLVAENGAEGVALYRERLKEIDLVILDMIMPVMNGREAFYQMKKVNNNVRVLVSSGFSKEDDLAELYHDGLVGFIRKPFRIDELSRTVKKVLSGDSSCS